MTPEVISQWTTLAIAIITAVVTIIIAIAVAWKKIKEAFQNGINTGVIVGAEATTQEGKDIFSSEKANAVAKKVSDALKNPEVPQIDTKVNKAINSAGGVLNIISQAVSLLKVVKPNVFKSKQ